MAKRRKSKRRRRSVNRPAPVPSIRRSKRLQVAGLGAVVLALTLITFFYLRNRQIAPATGNDSRRPGIPVAANHTENGRPADTQKAEPHGVPKGQFPPREDDSFGGDFLSSFQKDDSTGSDPKTNLSDNELEQHFRDVLKLFDERRSLESQLVSALEAKNFGQWRTLRQRSAELTGRLNRQLTRLEKELKQARANRPASPVVQWLTGELLMYVGGAPETVLPYLERAIRLGLNRPRLKASLARAYFDSNRFADAWKTVRDALAADGGQLYIWQTYYRIALGVEQFAELVRQLEGGFPNDSDRPPWAKEMLSEAKHYLAEWETELERRRRDQEKGDLPRVRLVIAHRRWKRDAAGNITSDIEVTGDGSVIVELFEDDAPKTVANFIELVEKHFYDGTLFVVAEPPMYVQGGDPNSRNSDPDDDGLGGPGYVIPDEFAVPNARHHFRGSLGMVNTGPGTAGSQFFITLTPNHRFDGHFTVFGRVVEGMDVIDHITPGRTTKRLGHFGSIVPGDLLVRAEVTRKRPHAYEARRLPLPAKDDKRP